MHRWAGLPAISACATPPAVRSTAVRGACHTKPCTRRGRVLTRLQSSGSSYDNNNMGGPAATLAAHRTWLRRQRVLHSEPHPSDGDIIELNVGGCVMVASRSTLRQVPGSLLGLLFDPDNRHHLVCDPSGRVFFDYDPAAFALVLRYLRELRVTGGCPSSVLLAPIPPSDAGPFRSLVSHLGLQIDEAAITAAAARGAAIAAAGGSSSSSYAAPGSSSGAGGIYRPSGSPYASRPAGSIAANSHCAPAQQQQQQWWQRQQQQQQQLVRPQPPEVPPSGLTDGNESQDKATHSTVRFRLASGSEQQEVTAAAAGAAAIAATGVGSSYRTPSQQPPQQQALATAADPIMQYYYLKTSKAPQLKGIAGLPAAALPVLGPLKVNVYAESDLLAHSQQSSSSSGRGTSHDGGAAGLWSGAKPSTGEGWGLLSGFDAFVSTSSSRQLMVFSMVVRGSAAVDNVFAGVTSSNHTDQRGLQIPSFGWKQIDVCATADADDECSTEAPSTYDDACSSTSSSVCGEPACKQMLWQCGDLVQLIVELGSTNKLLLKVNGLEVKGCYIDLPTFRQWCWYVAFFRGTEVVSVVFAPGSYSVYSGDHMLKRYLA